MSLNLHPIKLMKHFVYFPTIRTVSNVKYISLPKQIYCFRCALNYSFSNCAMTLLTCPVNGHFNQHILHTKWSSVHIGIGWNKYLARVKVITSAHSTHLKHMKYYTTCMCLIARHMSRTQLADSIFNISITPNRMHMQ